jgi:5-dehydro-2-deoxygluconokinase
VETLSRVAASRGGFGVLFDAAGGAALRQAARGPLWVARTVDRPGSQPLEFAAAESLALHLSDWPIDITVHCRCEYRADDPHTVREAQERSLEQLATVCRAQGREWLLEIPGGEERGVDADSPARALARLYALDIRPDWWALGPQPNSDAWEACTRVIAENDGYCRGVLLALDAAPAPAAALTLAAGIPLVRGFIAGGSIQTVTATAWLAGQLPDEAAVAQMAECFAAFMEAWTAARDPQLDQLQRSGI